MPKLHISMDHTGFWQMTAEDDDGNLTLISHGFPSSDHLLQDARELLEKGKVPPTTEIVVGQPKASEVVESERAEPYSKPAPQEVAE